MYVPQQPRADGSRVVLTAWIAGDLLNDFILSRISNGAEGLGHCARGLSALERLGTWDEERVKTVTNT